MADARIEWVDDERRLAELREPWNALADRHPTPFAAHEWFTEWWGAFGSQGDLRVGVLWDAERMRAALPLHGGRRRVAGMANVHSPDFGAMAEDEGALQAVLEAALDGPWGEIHLEALRQEDPTLEKVLTVAGSRSIATVTEPGAISPVVDLTVGAEAWLEESRPRWGAPLPRFRRKMGRDHDAVFSLVEPPTDLEGELERGLEVEASGWKGRAGTAILSTPETARFYRGIARAYSDRGQLRLSGIVLDGRLAAFDLSLLHAGRLWLLKTGFDEAFRRLAPGLVLRLAIVERCFELGLDGHELLGGDDEWKRKFANDSRSHRRVHLYRRRPLPLARYAYRRAVRPPLRGAYHRLRRLR